MRDPLHWSGAGRERLYGVYPALVTDLGRPTDGRNGLVRVKLPWVDEDQAEQAQVWARLSTALAGKGRGTWLVPQPGDEVLVAFVAGDPRRPVITGALWNGEDEPPEQMDAGKRNQVRSLTTDSGHVLRFHDGGHISLQSAGGHEVRLDDTQGTVTVSHAGGPRLVLGRDGSVRLTATTTMTLNAPAGLTVNAAQVKVNAASSDFSGVVKAPVVIADEVVGSSYTPGDGNVW